MDLNNDKYDIRVKLSLNMMVGGNLNNYVEVLLFYKICLLINQRVLVTRSLKEQYIIMKMIRCIKPKSILLVLSSNQR